MTSPRGYVHEVRLDLVAGSDPAAPGGAVTVALCGSWDHDGPCRWPHHNDIDTDVEPARLRTVFVVAPEECEEVRRRIDDGLAAGDGWRVVAAGPDALSDDEQTLAGRIGAEPPPS